MIIYTKTFCYNLLIINYKFLTFCGVLIMKLYAEKELVPVIYGETAVKILSFSAVKNQKAFPSHWHERMEFHLVKSGTLKLICDDEEILINPGEVSIISPAVTHSGEPKDEGVKYDIIMFDPYDLYNRTISAKQYLEPIINGNIRFCYKTDNPQIVGVVNEIILSHSKKENVHPLENIGLIYKLLGLLHLYCVDDNYKAITVKKYFDDVINYIDANFMKDISVDTICSQFNYNKSYFCRKFKRETGINASEYIRIRRLEYSRNLLENTKNPIKNIAIYCGFSNGAYFVNCFKKMYGITPTQYRKSIQKI